MNDFTKEELEELYECLHAMGVHSQNRLLKDKIQSMIDNYCEHKNTDPDSAVVDFCLDCNWIGFKKYIK